MASSNPTITHAFLGATGGCCNAALAHSLKAGVKAIALARTPAKLTSLLQSQGLDDETLKNNLTIVQGDATDVSALKSTIAPEQNNGALVSTIISGLGGSPRFQASIFQPVTLDNPHICEEATKALIAAVKELQKSGQQQQKQPLLTVISTTGISDVKEDVPIYNRPLYHYVLSVPHKDKRVMEKLAKDSMKDTPAPFKGVISIRPSLLLGDHTISSGKGWQTVRAGTEENPATGFGIPRADVGEWIFEEIVRGGGDKWVNKMVTVTS